MAHATTDLPFAARAEVRLPRRKVFHSFVRDVAPFALTSVSGDEAPLSYVASSGRLAVRVRAHGGDGYVAVSSDKHGLPALEAMPRTMILSEPGAPYLVKGLKGPEEERAYRESMEGAPAGSARLAMPDRARDLEGASVAYHDALVLVDGCPWRRLHVQPCWTVEDRGADVAVRLSLEGKCSGEQVFGPTRRDEAVAFAEFVARGRRVDVDPDHAVAVTGDAEPSFRSAVAQAVSVTGWLGPAHLSDFPVGLGRACVRLWAMALGDDGADAEGWAREVLAEASSYADEAEAGTALPGSAGKLARSVMSLRDRTAFDAALAEESAADLDALLPWP